MQLRLVSALVVAALLSACAGSGGGLGSISKTNQLAPGMKPLEVRAILGEPSQTQFSSNRWVWKYTLHEPWKGFIPYYLVFGQESQKLEQWYADEDEYMKQQQLWLQAMPPVRRQ
jgi:outer membrane protein assembly factor BamE (lipoprotein component of BamABCDE complex)